MSDERARILCRELIHDIRRHKILTMKYEEALEILRDECEHDWVRTDVQYNHHVCTICGREDLK